MKGVVQRKKNTHDEIGLIISKKKNVSDSSKKYFTEYLCIIYNRKLIVVF